ncbi:MAG: Blp family class II bacteriocin [Nostoc sp. EkiNYC01]|nr:Blp family class II bacteriocin [Nostoc sp. EkiNYC01]
MANIQISDLDPVQTEFYELSDLELEAIVGGKGNAQDVLEGAATGAAIGSAIGGPGGAAVGAVVGGLVGLLSN